LNAHAAKRLLFKSFKLVDLSSRLSQEETRRTAALILKQRNAAHLADKIVVIPFAVRDIFVTEPVDLRGRNW
jgi:hypothetical protein